MVDKALNAVTGNNSDNQEFELELSDEDILDAMQHIPGYLDISTEDFRSIYHLAYRHAQERLLGKVTAARFMRSAVAPLSPHLTLSKAVQYLANSGYKSLPVVDDQGCVIGMLTETDFLKHLGVESFLQLLSSMLDSSFELVHRCHEVTVGVAMTQPAISVSLNAGFVEIIEAFGRHQGRSMPVVEENGRLLGLLLRKDFLRLDRPEQ